MSGIYIDRKENVTDPNLRPGSLTITDSARDRGYQAEAQYLFRADRFNITAGGGAYRFDVAMAENRNDGTGSCGDDNTCDQLRPGVQRQRDNAYIYTNISLPKNITATLGLSYDFFKNDINQEDFFRLDLKHTPEDQKSFSFAQFSPKIGLQWNIVRDLRLRLAWFETVKSALAANQTIEPTQVAGFNQMFDDVNGTRARRIGGGLDARIANKLYGGFEVSARNLDVPIFRTYLSLSEIVKQQEQLYRTYLYWLPHRYWALRGEFQFEKFTQDPNGTNPSKIQTLSAPLSLDYFHPSGVFAKFVTTYVQQEVARGNSKSNVGVNDFVLLDTTIGYRLPNRRGIFSLEGRNLLNEDFFFRNIGLQQSEQPLYNQRYSPDRTFFLRLTLNF